MPTVILLDVSLSMSRPIATSEGHEETSRRHLAVAGINPFLDYLASNCKLEFVSLVQIIIFGYFLQFLLSPSNYHVFYENGHSLNILHAENVNVQTEISHFDSKVKVLPKLISVS